MKPRGCFKSIWIAVGLMCLASLIAACSGGGGSSSGSPAAPSGTGSVAVLITDGPSVVVDELKLTISKITLIPARNETEVVIYQDETSEPINVLNYKSKEEPYFLTLKEEVPAGYYAKIRLEIENIEVVGGPCEDKYIKLPSGKIDLNPRGGFYVNEGESIAIQLDFDANKWFNLHQAGNSGKCILRPVIFVDIDTLGLQQRCPKIIKGSIEKVDSSTKFLIKLAGNRGSVWVFVDADTVIVNEKGEVTPDTSILEPGDTVYVRGRLTQEGILASLVVEGDVLKVDGTAGDDATDGSFQLIPDPGEALIDPTNVLVSGDTLILLDCNTTGSVDNIVQGTKATVIGKLSAEGLIAVAILIEPAEITGTLTEIIDPQGAETSYQFIILKGGGATETIVVPADTPIHLVGDGPLQISDLKQLVNTCQVYPEVRILLDTATPDEKIALKMLVYPEELTGTVVSVEKANGIIVLNVAGVDKKIKVDESAKIFESDEDCEILFLKDIKKGDDLTVFGIPTCTSDPSDPDFIAYTVVLDGWGEDDHDKNDKK